MAVVLAFAFVGGLLTILSPCVLPVVPLVLGTTVRSDNRRLVGVAGGFAGSFVLTTVLLASTLAAAGITTDALRLASALGIGFLGLTLAIPALGTWVSARLVLPVELGSGIARRAPGGGLVAGIAIGAAIGLLWAPCVGPIMATVIATAVVSGPSASTAGVALAYAGGAVVPLVLFARAGRRAVHAFGRAELRERLIRGFGVLTIAAASLVATGLDVTVEAAVANAIPARLSSAIIGIEVSPIMGNVGPAAGTEPSAGSPPGRLSSGTAGASPPVDRAPLDDLGPAPELAGITTWINSGPITLASLRGKVVLVHFWTFECINCIHVQPYVKAWYERYAKEGFVVLGVHTPELSFERDIGNVRAAVADDGIRFPVAFDPAFATWNAYGNRYWPAFYFIDRAGHVRHVHFGEGDYDGSERVIQQLLAESD